MSVNTALWVGCIFGALTYGWILPWVGDKLGMKKKKAWPQMPCELCAFNPPSSRDGKPCSVCPASAVYRDGEADRVAR